MHADVVEHVERQRVGHGDQNPTVLVDAKGHDAVLTWQSQWECCDQLFGTSSTAGRVSRNSSPYCSLRARVSCRLIDRLHPNQDLAHEAALVALFAEGVGEMLSG